MMRVRIPGAVYLRTQETVRKSNDSAATLIMYLADTPMYCQIGCQLYVVGSAVVWTLGFRVWCVLLAPWGSNLFGWPLQVLLSAV